MNTQSPSKPADLKSALVQLESTLEEYMVKKAPFQIPENIKNILVKIAPWFIILSLIITVPGILLVFGLGAVVAPLAVVGGPGSMVSYGLTYLISMGVTIVSLVINIIALPGLFKRSIGSWRLLFYSQLISLAASVVSLNVSTILGALIGAVIGFYVLFQVKSCFK